MKHIVIVLLLALTACEDNYYNTYTLYRGSKADPDLRIHIASFDTADGLAYNRENCEIAARLFQTQPGVTVRYWCEKGRYRK